MIYQYTQNKRQNVQNLLRKMCELTNKGSITRTCKWANIQEKTNIITITIIIRQIRKSEINMISAFYGTTISFN